MSPDPCVRGSGLSPFFLIVLPVTTVLLDEPNPKGFLTIPTPTVPLPFTLLLRIVTSWPPTFRIPLPDGSNCRSSKDSSTHPGGVSGASHTGGNGLGRLLLCTVLSSI